LSLHEGLFGFNFAAINSKIQHLKKHKMKKNMGLTDKIIRIVLAAIMLTLYFTHVVTGVFGIVLVVLAVVFVFTSTISMCPLYSIFGCSTCKTKDA
jgi:uncharacterized membrane protein